MSEKCKKCKRMLNRIYMPKGKDYNNFIKVKDMWICKKCLILYKINPTLSEIWFTNLKEGER